MSKRMLWFVLALSVSALAYYASTFGFGNALSPTTRYRIILAMLFAQSAGIIVLGATLFSVLAELRPYQRAASQLAVMKGMWRTLDIANEKGGVSAEARAAVYREVDQVFSQYSNLMREGERGA